VHYRSLFTELVNKGGQPSAERSQDGDGRTDRERAPEQQRERERRPSFRKREARPR
jgi:hypothetical protein